MEGSLYVRNSLYLKRRVESSFSDHLTFNQHIKSQKKRRLLYFYVNILSVIIIFFTVIILLLLLLHFTVNDY